MCTAIWRMFVLCVLVVSGSATYAQGFLNGKVTDVGDGDTLTLLADGKIVKIRFYGVDCPEKQGEKWPDQPGWKAARDFVAQKVNGKEVTVRLKGEQTFGREVGEVFVGGQSLSRELLREGHAWWNDRFSEDDLDLQRLEAEAKAKKSGIWRDGKAVAPWTWRRMDHGAAVRDADPADERVDVSTSSGGLSGEALRQAVHEEISEHKVLTYDEVWDALKYTDEDPENTNNVILLYTGWSVSKSRNGGDPSDWNREHTWAKSHGDFGTRKGAGTDIHHLRPCDVTVNSRRGNLDFDDGGTEYTDPDGDTDCNVDRDSWEPRDEDKGDVARMMFYMDVRYESNPDLQLVDGVTDGRSPRLGDLATLLEWSRQDPPSAFEKRRNDRIEEIQGNRNPFIDDPALADRIWPNN